MSMQRIIVRQPGIEPEPDAGGRFFGCIVEQAVDVDVAQINRKLSRKSFKQLFTDFAAEALSHLLAVRAVFRRWYLRHDCLV